MPEGWVIELADPIRDILEEAAESSAGTDDTADAIVTLVERWANRGTTNHPKDDTK